MNVNPRRVEAVPQICSAVPAKALTKNKLGSEGDRFSKGIWFDKLMSLVLERTDWSNRTSFNHCANPIDKFSPIEELRAKVEASYREQTDVRYAAARLWVDKILDPAETRQALLLALEVTLRSDNSRPFRTGVLQV